MATLVVLLEGHAHCFYRVAPEHQHIKSAVESSSLGVREGPRTLGGF